RLLAAEGIHLWFDHEDAATLVLDDSSLQALDLGGGAALAMASESGLDRDDELCLELFSEAVATADGFTVRSFDPRRPDLLLEGRAGSGSIEWYDAGGGGPRDPDGCVRQALLARQAAGARAHTVRGVASPVELRPARV